MARRADRQDQVRYLKELEKNRQREMDIKVLEQERKMANYFGENIQKEEKVILFEFRCFHF